jgi:hypothetical protein
LKYYGIHLNSWKFPWISPVNQGDFIRFAWIRLDFGFLQFLEISLLAVKGDGEYVAVIQSQVSSQKTIENQHWTNGDVTKKLMKAW